MAYHRPLLFAPPVKVDPDDLDAFLPFSLLYLFLLPFFPFFATTYHHHVPRRTGAVPHWSLELERWYNLFHPQTWVVLHAEHVDDVKHLRAVNSEVGTYGSDARRSPDGLRWLAHMETQQALLETRIFIRWIRLLALHEVRSIFCARFREKKPAFRGITNWQIVRDQVIEAEDVKPLPAEPHQVWPLPIPPPAPQRRCDTGEDLEVVVVRAPRTLLDYLSSSSSSFERFVLPEFPSDDAMDAWDDICTSLEPLHVILDDDAECASGGEVDTDSFEVAPPKGSVERLPLLRGMRQRGFFRRLS
ncbi:hypothetical protein JCM10213v2_005233 [Rhodosporidiobolus nylandii]